MNIRAVMKPEWTPPWPTRNAGSLVRWLFSSVWMRRSAIGAHVVTTLGG